MPYFTMINLQLYTICFIFLVLAETYSDSIIFLDGFYHFPNPHTHAASSLSYGSSRTDHKVEHAVSKMDFLFFCKDFFPLRDKMTKSENMTCLCTTQWLVSRLFCGCHSDILTNERTKGARRRTDVSERAQFDWEPGSTSRLLHRLLLIRQCVYGLFCERSENNNIRHSHINIIIYQSYNTSNGITIQSAAFNMALWHCQWLAWTDLLQGFDGTWAVSTVFISVINDGYSDMNGLIKSTITLHGRLRLMSGVYGTHVQSVWASFPISVVS